MTTRFIEAGDVARLIPNGATVFCTGMGLAGFPEEVAKAIEAAFLATGHPRDLTLYHSTGVGNGKDRGMHHFAHEGLIKRLVGGHFGVGGPNLMKLIMEERIEAYNLPQGVLALLPRQVAGRRPGFITKVGLGTFVDPRIEGGKVNRRTEEDLVKLIEMDGEEWLQFKAPKVDVALIRGSVADEKGNITMDREGVLLESLSVAQAARASGGIVIAQVEHVVRAGSLHPKQVKIPGVVVDYVVVGKAENHLQTMATYFNPAYAGDIKVLRGSTPPLPLDPRKIIARRAAMELKAGAVVNLGIGMPEGVAAVAAEEHVDQLMSLTLETGPIGGVPAGGFDFGHALNAEAVIEQPAQFDFYDGGGIDVAFLGLAQTDAAGNVNVSKFNGRPVGCGGFINITQNARKVVFCGTFTAGDLEVEIADGRVTVVQEGGHSKFLEQVEQITFSGRYAQGIRQPVLYVTERAVFRLTEEGMELVEIAPGIDLERDVLAHMRFRPIIRDLTLMDAEIFKPEWGGLAGLLGERG
ncbi:MAG: malonate decarboxylase subunit alpha [Proteobacteria bacterium]|nr:malonate decarboxylase subunit alpha [Pseudomonadota bacterium]